MREEDSAFGDLQEDRCDLCQDMLGWLTEKQKGDDEVTFQIHLGQPGFF